MQRTQRLLLWMIAVTLTATVAWGQDPVPPAATAETDEVIQEVIVVTASRTEQVLSEAPAAISVLTAKDIAEIPSDDYGDLLRNVPGVNVSQTSARDINMTSRGSTNTLSTSQLVLLDGRSIYLDFFGFVMWDFLPVNPAEIKQIEAVRGPGSAVWGANAMTGVVNLITKRPKEMVGTSILLGAGEIGTRLGSVSHAGVHDRLGYKISAGYFEQDAYDRPTGVIPGSSPPVLYPNFPNSGTKQPKIDTRFDWDLTDDSTLNIGGGYAGTDGIIHTGIGPFDIDSGSNLSNFKVDWQRRALHVGVFANFLDADSVNLLTRGTNGKPLGFKFSTDTYNAELSNTSVAGLSNIFTYGGNYRTSDFKLQIAPKGTKKDEWGVFIQDEILIGEKARWVIGGRWDEIDPLKDGVFTPRTSLLFSPTPRHTFRVSYNEAFRSPSAINSYLDVSILQPLSATIAVQADADGNVVLKEERLTAYEVGYVGNYANGVTMTAAVYRNETDDSIDFFTKRVYGPGNLPTPGPFLPAQLVPCFLFAPGTGPAACPLRGLGGFITSNYSYRNIGKTTDRGVELTLQQRRDQWNWFFNGSWQDTPEFEGLTDISDQNLPPEYRANLGVSYDPGFWFVNTNVNYQDEAFWGDVLFGSGTTDAFTTLNIGVGVRLLDERMTLQLQGANITDVRVQQHIFGDIISRKITGQVAFRF